MINEDLCFTFARLNPTFMSDNKKLTTASGILYYHNSSDLGVNVEESKSLFPHKSATQLT